MFLYAYPYTLKFRLFHPYGDIYTLSYNLEGDRGYFPSDNFCFCNIFHHFITTLIWNADLFFSHYNYANQVGTDISSVNGYGDIYPKPFMAIFMNPVIFCIQLRKNPA